MTDTTRDVEPIPHLRAAAKEVMAAERVGSETGEMFLGLLDRASQLRSMPAEEALEPPTAAFDLFWEESEASWTRRTATRVYDERVRLVTFARNGSLIFVLGWLVQLALIHYARWSHDWSYVAQTAVSIAAGFTIHRRSTFAERRIPLTRAFAKYSLQQSVVTGVGVGGYVGLEALHVQWIAANVIVTLVLAPASFLSSYLWSLTEASAPVSTTEVTPATSTSSSYRVHAGVYTSGIHRFSPARHPLPWLLVIQAVLSMRLIWSNTAFTDEALYISAGHLEWQHWLHGLNISGLGFPTYFSGAPVVYPPIAAGLDTLGGLPLVRCLSMAFMMGTTIAIWFTAKKLYDHRSAAYACALFTVVGTGQDLGAFADYTAMAVFFTAIALWLGVRAAYCTSLPARLSLSVFTGVTLVIADASKYAAGLWSVLVLAVAFTLTWRESQLRSAFTASITMTLTWAGGVVAAVAWGGAPYVEGIKFTTVTRSVTDTSPAATVFWLGFTYVWVIVVLSVMGVIMNLTSPWSEKLFYLALAAAALAAPINQARIHTYSSLYKHVVFGAVFGVLVAGSLIAKASHVNERKGWRIGASILAVAALAGYGQGTSQFNFWPDATKMITAIRPMVTTETGPILADQSHVVPYYLGTVIRPNQVSGVSKFSVARIKAHYYSIIEIDFSFPSEYTADEMNLRAVEATPGYRLVYMSPWNDAFHNGNFRIWTYEGSVK